jgi:transposase
LRETSNIYAKWERLQPYFPDRQAGDKGRPHKDSRQILNGILWIARSGAAWRDLPERYGAWQTIYKRFVFHDLGADADLQDISIDSTYIKAHKSSAGAAKKGNAIPKTNAKTNASE